MKDQINTIRRAVEAALSDDQPYIEACKQALTALSELESSLAQYEAGDVASAAAQGFRDGVASVTQQEQEQEPVAWLCIVNTADAGPTKFFTAPSDPRGFPVYAAPVAQQPQARPDFADEWTGYLKDGETPFERFLRERKDVQSVLKLYQRALEENERLKDQQPQAEAVPPDVVLDADVEAAAKKMAEIFDYPWDFMPEKGRNTMRENVRAVLAAAQGEKP